MKIFHKDTNEVIFSSHFAQSMKECVEEAIEEGVSLHKGDFSGMDLSGIDLKKVNISFAKFTNTNLDGVIFKEANVEGSY